MPTLAGALGQPYQQRCRQHCMRHRIPFSKGPEKTASCKKALTAAFLLYPLPVLTGKSTQRLGKLKDANSNPARIIG